MKKIILLSIFLLCLFHQLSYACTCFTPPTFCEGVSYPGMDMYIDLVLRGKVIDNLGNTEVEIDETLFGTTNLETMVLIATQCWAYTGPLEEGKDYIFVVREYEDKFYFADCIISYLPIENEVVMGSIASGVESINYSDFPNIESCINSLTTSIENELSAENNLSIFPNPTTDILTIQNSNSQVFAKNIQIELIDMVGKKLQTFKKEDGILVGETWSINLQDFSSGVYFLKLIANNQENVIRIVKQ